MTGPMTLQEIAEVLGVTRQAVAETESRALRKLRMILTTYGIYSYKDISVGELFQFAADHDIHAGKYK